MSSSSMRMSAKSYTNIIGANIACRYCWFGRRLAHFTPPLPTKSNVRLAMQQSQMNRAAERFKKHISYKPTLEQNIIKVLEDDKVDVLINAMPDHSTSIMAMKSGKHVYVEKPSSCTMEEMSFWFKLPKNTIKWYRCKTNNAHRFTPSKSQEKYMMVKLVLPTRQ